MSKIFAVRWAAALMLAGALVASPADAQGKKDRKNDRERPELIRRDDYKEREKALKEDYKRREETVKREYERRQEALRRDRDRYESRDRDRYEDNDRRDLDEAGPPFCRNGQGHPVHGRRWCEEKGYGLGRNVGRYDDRYENDRRYDDGYGSYAQEHEDFHRRLDRKYSEMAARRPLDIQWQLRVRSEKQAEHDRWHDRAGRRH